MATIAQQRPQERESIFVQDALQFTRVPITWRIVPKGWGQDLALPRMYWLQGPRLRVDAQVDVISPDWMRTRIGCSRHHTNNAPKSDNSLETVNNEYDHLLPKVWITPRISEHGERIRDNDYLVVLTYHHEFQEILGKRSAGQPDSTDR